MRCRLLLVRHGQSTWNAEGRWQGWSDPPLSRLGESQAAEAAVALGGVGATSVWASDLVRARATADVIAAHLALGPVATDPDLREFHVGDWEGRTRPEIQAGWPEELAAWRAGTIVATPGGETRVHFEARVQAALQRLAATGDRADGNVVVATHGGVIRAAERLSAADRSEVIDNLAGRWFDVDGEGELRAGERVNLLGGQRRTASPSP
jgi:probable phosphoglycerate mutase